MNITVKVDIFSDIKKVWSAWTSSDDIIKWNFASDDWCCPQAKIDLKAGGRFSYRMEAKDGSFGFDFSGELISIDEYKRIEFKLDDNRKVMISFESAEDFVSVVETFEAENDNPVDLQQQGWQCILDNFKKHVESST